MIGKSGNRPGGFVDKGRLTDTLWNANKKSVIDRNCFESLAGVRKENNGNEKARAETKGGGD
jgi:hypothetical protein